MRDGLDYPFICIYIFISHTSFCGEMCGSWNIYCNTRAHVGTYVFAFIYTRNKKKGELDYYFFSSFLFIRLRSKLHSIGGIVVGKIVRFFFFIEHRNFILSIIAKYIVAVTFIQLIISLVPPLVCRNNKC